MSIKIDLRAELEAALGSAEADAGDLDDAFGIEDTADLPLEVTEEDFEVVEALEAEAIVPMPEPRTAELSNRPPIDLATLLGEAPLSGLPPPESQPPVFLPRSAPKVPAPEAHAAPAPESDHGLGAQPLAPIAEDQATEVSPTVARRGTAAAFVRWFLGNNTAQVVGLGGLGLGIVAIWTALEAQRAPDPASAPGLASAQPGPSRFPSLEVEGRNDPISPDDVQRLLELRARARAEAAARAEAPQAPEPPRPGLVVLRPGQLADPDTVDDGPGVIAGGGPERRSGPPRSPSPSPKRGQWFTPGGLLEGVGGAAHGENGSLPLVAGDRLTAKLEVGIASTQHQTVVARLTQDLKKDGQTVLRKGDVLLGRSRNDDARVYIDLLKVRTGGETYGIQGYAVGGDLPGLLARRREATFEERSKAKAVGGAVRGVAQELGEALADASVLGRVARGATQGPAEEASREVAVETGFVLEVPAGKVFEVVIVGGGGRP